MHEKKFEIENCVQLMLYLNKKKQKQKLLYVSC